MDAKGLLEISNIAKNLDIVVLLGMLPSLNKGLSKVIDLLISPLMREKIRRDRLSCAQTEHDIQAIKEDRAYFDGKNLVSTMPELTPLHNFPTSWSALPSHQLPMAASLLEEGENLHATLSLAMEELARTSDDKISDKAVDKDWFSRWRAEARLVTSDELRRMWARILVEEVKDPETVSLKTLDILKNLTKKDIDVFIKVARLHIGHLIYVYYDNIETNYLFVTNTSEAVLLQNSGLLSEVTFSLVPNKCCENNNKKCEIICYGTKFVINAEELLLSSNKFCSFQLSLAAQELLSIADNIPTLSDEESISIGNYIFNMANKKYYIRAIRMTNDETIHVWQAEKTTSQNKL